MFFRREKPRQLTFDDYLERLQSAGFSLQQGSDSRHVAVRHGCAAVIRPGEGSAPLVEKGGVLIGNEIAALVDGGFQKFLVTRDGRKHPALSTHLKALHDFQEDMKEALGLTSLYNEGLGTVSHRHMYDRVENRDSAAESRPWEQSPGASSSTPAASK
jgi:hypothetical protein